MANKLNFLSEEWATLLESTTVAGIAVSAAEPSGLWGTLKEFLASSSALDAAKRDPHSNELVAAVIAELETEEGQSKLHKALHKRFGKVRIRLTSFRTHLSPCGRRRRFSTQESPPMRPPSRLGSLASARRSPKRQVKAAFSALAAFK